MSVFFVCGFSDEVVGSAPVISGDSGKTGCAVRMHQGYVPEDPLELLSGADPFTVADPACRHEVLSRISSAQPQEHVAGAVTDLRRKPPEAFRREEPFDISPELARDTGGAMAVVFRGLGQLHQVVRCQMLFDRCVSELPFADMGGYTPSVNVYPDEAVGVGNQGLLSDIPVRDGVVVRYL